jgi:regulator of sigma E protease
MLGFGEDFLWLLVLIGVMIMIHEFGHFWAARFFDVKVETFSLGFGPRLFGFKRGETDYRFSLILFGGYVKMAGELLPETAGKQRDPSALLTGPNEGSTAADDPRALPNKPRWQRLIISFAGPFMNIVLAVGVLTGLYMVKYEKVADADLHAVIGHVVPGSPAAKAGIQDGDKIIRFEGKKNPSWDEIGLKEMTSAGRPLHVTVERNGTDFDTTVTPVLSEKLGVGYAGWDERAEIQLAGVEPGYPAEKAGLKKGDLIVAVNGQPLHSATRFQEITKNSGGRPIEIQYKRDGELHSVTVQPVMSKLDGPAHYMIGVQPQQKLHLITTRLSLPAALAESVRQNSKGALLMVDVLKGMVERRLSPKSLSGPIGIAQMSGAAAREGAADFLYLMATISLQLAIINLLPIPILDGGAILMLIIEMVMQRDMSLNVKEAVFKVGFVFIMMLVAFAVYNDISKLLPTG